MPIFYSKIKNTVFSMAHNKYPCLDGLLVEVFQNFWGIVGIKVSNLVREVQYCRHLIKSQNATFLALISKVVDSKDYKQFFLINLCNVVYTILTKTLANRLKLILPHLIFLEQDGFIQGIEIMDGIIKMYEILHLAQIKNMVIFLLKLDMQKAYDRVNSSFLDKIYKKFGFSKTWRSWIHQCRSTTSFYILFNGESLGFFCLERGIRQGDQISLYLFIIMEEALGIKIRNWRNTKKIYGIKSSNVVIVSSHSQFIDEMIIMGKASVVEVRNYWKFLQLYEGASK